MQINTLLVKEGKTIIYERRDTCNTDDVFEMITKPNTKYTIIYNNIPEAVLRGNFIISIVHNKVQYRRLNELD